MAHGKRANECNQPQWHDGPSQSARQPIQASVRQTNRRSKNAEKSFLIKFPVKLSIFYSLCLPSPFGEFDTMFGFAFVPGRCHRRQTNFGRRNQKQSKGCFHSKKLHSCGVAATQRQITHLSKANPKTRETTQKPQSPLPRMVDWIGWSVNQSRWFSE